jgi:hypothetical protein
MAGNANTVPICRKTEGLGAEREVELADVHVAHLTGMTMINVDSSRFPPRSRVEKRQAETEKVFLEMRDKERTERLAKTMRLRGLRLTNSNGDNPKPT